MHFECFHCIRIVNKESGTYRLATNWWFADVVPMASKRFVPVKQGCKARLEIYSNINCCFNWIPEKTFPQPLGAHVASNIQHKLLWHHCQIQGPVPQQRKDIWCRAYALEGALSYCCINHILPVCCQATADSKVSILIITIAFTVPAFVHHFARHIEPLGITRLINAPWCSSSHQGRSNFRSTWSKLSAQLHSHTWLSDRPFCCLGCGGSKHVSIPTIGLAHMRQVLLPGWGIELGRQWCRYYINFCCQQQRKFCRVHCWKTYLNTCNSISPEISMMFGPFRTHKWKHLVDHLHHCCWLHFMCKYWHSCSACSHLPWSGCSLKTVLTIKIVNVPSHSIAVVDAFELSVHMGNTTMQQKICCDQCWLQPNTKLASSHANTIDDILVYKFQQVHLNQS